MFKSIKNMFGLQEHKESLQSPIAGEVIPVTQVSDPTFGEEIVGKGVAIIPTDGHLVSPVNGTISMVFETKHAVTMISEEGAEILIHIGLDTVKLKGQYFETFVTSGQVVKAGDKLVEFDLEAIKNAGYDTVTPMVVCNPHQYKEISIFPGKQHKLTDKVIVLHKA